MSRRPGGNGAQVRRSRLASGLTQEQVRLLAFLRDFTARNPYPPTVRELARGCGISSASVADRHLRRLEEGEYLTRRPGIARGRVLTERGRTEAPPPAECPVVEAS